MTDTTTDTTTELTGRALIDAKAKKTFDSTSTAFEAFTRFVSEMQDELTNLSNFRDSFLDDDGLTEVTWASSGLASSMQSQMSDFAARATSESARHNRSINITRDHEMRVLRVQQEG